MSDLPDAEWKTIVCLANSRKLSGRCVAGVEIRGQRPVGWIRPVSVRPHREVSEYERQFQDGSDPAVLDVINVPLLRPDPHLYQSENWVLDPSNYWQRERVLEWRELAFLAEDAPLWLEGGSSTYHGVNDRIDEGIAASIRGSLRLIHVSDLNLKVFDPGADFGNPKRRVQARFSHAGTTYHLRVTDPVFERDYLARANGIYAVGEAYLTVSLGEVYDGNVYKLVAAIITPARAQHGV